MSTQSGSFNVGDSDASGSRVEEENEESYSACVRLVNYIVKGWMSPLDSADDRMRKRLGVPLSMVVCTTQILLGLKNIFLGPFFLTLNLARTVVLMSLLLYSRVTGVFPRPFVEFAVGFYAIFYSFVGDVWDYGTEDIWSTSILLTDVLLLFRCRQAALRAMVSFTVVFLIVKTTEEAIRFGLYDWVDWGQTTTQKPEAKGLGWLSTTLSVRLIVFLGDFAMTQRFVLGLKEEQQHATQAVELAQLIADALVEFDLNKAEMLVRKSKDTKLTCAFRALLSNLHVYRPFLPDALFTSITDPYDESTPLRERMCPPGVDEKDVTIVFTDIESSTHIWETYTFAMEQSMLIHNTIMRQCTRLSNGYEVKTIGDAFMVSFSSAQEAIFFCFEAQCRLLNVCWPEGLGNHKLCKPISSEGNLYWNGLRVRMGVHKGPAQLDVNPVTQRADYMGLTVNQASRVEAASVGGGIVITDDVYFSLSLTDNSLGGPPLHHEMGLTLLRGVGEVNLHLLTPFLLASRHSELIKLIEKKTKKLDNEILVKRWRSSTTTTTKDRLRLTRATAVTARVDFSCLSEQSSVADGANLLLGCLLDSSERSEGLVSSVFGSCITVVWNAGKRCTMHVAQAANYVLSCNRLLETKNKSYLTRNTFGMYTGAVFHGVLGPSRQRFVTVLGHAIDMTYALSDCAVELGTFCLLAGESSAAQDPTFGLHTRPVDTWIFTSGKELIYQLNMKTFIKAQGAWNLYTDVIPDDWGKLFWDAFLSEDVETMKLLAPDCDVVSYILQILKKEKSLPRLKREGLGSPFITPEQVENSSFATSSVARTTVRLCSLSPMTTVELYSDLL